MWTSNWCSELMHFAPYSEVRLLQHFVFLLLLQNLHTVFNRGYTNISPQGEFPFLHVFVNLCYFVSFRLTAILTGMKPPDEKWGWLVFHILVGHLCVSSENCLFRSLVHSSGCILFPSCWMFCLCVLYLISEQIR